MANLDVLSLPPMVPPSAALTVTPGSLGSGSPITSHIDAVHLAQAGLRYYGFSAMEIGGLGQGASFAIRNDQSHTAGSRIDTVTLAPGKSTSDWYGPEGLAADGGLSVEWLSGSFLLVVKYKSMTGADVTWVNVGRAQANSGTTPWDFSSQDLSGAGSTVIRSTATPPGLIEGASFLTCSCDGSDHENGRARMMIQPPTWPSTRRYLRVFYWLYLPVGWKASIPVGGSAQTWKFDCFPVINNQVFLLYYQTDDVHKLVVKDANVDSDITGTFAISEGTWHRIQIQMLLATGPTGWAQVWLDGTLVASGNNVKTIYAADNGSGNKLPYVRYGLAAHGVGQTLATTCSIDDCSLDYST